MNKNKATNQKAKGLEENVEDLKLEQEINQKIKIQEQGKQQAILHHPLQQFFPENFHHKEQLKNIFEKFNFEKDIKPALEQFQSIGFNKTYFSKLYKHIPMGFVSLNSETANKFQEGSQIKSDIFQIKKYLLQIGVEESQQKFVILKLPEIFEIGLEELNNRIQYLKDTFGYSNNNIANILVYYPQMIDSQYKVNITQKLSFLDSWLQISPQQIAPVVLKFPWIIGVESNQFKENIRILTTNNFPQENILQILNKDPEFLSMNPENLKRAFNVPVKLLKVPNPVYVKNMTNDPRLLTICPTTVMHIKPKILMEDFDIPQNVVKAIYSKYPEVFVKSIGSLKIKMKYLTERSKMDVDNDPIFPKILSYNYSNIIRPRGEAMIKTQNLYPFSEILDLSDEEFCKKVEIKPEDFQKIKNVIPYSDELDIIKKPFKKNFGNYQKYLDNYNQEFQQQQQSTSQEQSQQ